VLHEALDGTALSGSVATLENNHVTAAGAVAVFLQLQQLNLQAPFQMLIFVA
jgi:hypothetical protein